MAVIKISRFRHIMSLCRLLRTFSTSPRVNSNHYDILGITPKATQGDIKSAYYKLSKVYHPDKSSDEASAKQFRKITEAYEVLGNLKLKKIYDKGLLVGRENTTRMHYEPEPEPSDPTLRFYKSRTTRHVTPTMDGHKPVYDFDAWSKHHYGTTFQRQQYEKEFIKIKKAKQAEIVKATNQEAIIYGIIVIGFLLVIVTANPSNEFDKNLIESKTAAESTDTISYTNQSEPKVAPKSQ